MVDAVRVLVPAARVPRWFENFGVRHGSFSLSVTGGGLTADAEDGAYVEARLPWDLEYSGGASAELFAEAATAPLRWGLLLVRRGGFAVAGGTTPVPAATKVGKRHVQGQTKAGGWSQQRYARRRANQASAAFDAAAGHAERILVTELGGVDALVCGGDRQAVDSVLAHPVLARLAARRTSRWLATPDPNATVLGKAVTEAWSVQVVVQGGQEPATSALPGH